MRLKDKKGPLCMILASICWSFGGLCIKFIPWDAAAIIGVRAMFAAAVFAAYRRDVRIKFTGGNVLTALCLSATTILFVYANKLTTAASAILLQFTAPVFIILIHLAVYGKKPKPAELAAVAATVAGMLLFFADSLGFNFLGGGGAPGGTFGNLLAVASGLSFAGVFVCNRRKDVDTEQALFLGFLINSTVCLPFVAAGVTAEPVAWGFAVFLGIVQVGFAYIFFSVGIKRTPALLACLITAMEPVLNPVWVMIATGERPGALSIIGGAVIIAAVVRYNFWFERNAGKEGREAP